jgi:hypothetical protein
VILVIRVNPRNPWRNGYPRLQAWRFRPDHMPAHVYIRTGDYAAAVKTNQVNRKGDLLEARFWTARRALLEGVRKQEMTGRCLCQASV